MNPVIVINAFQRPQSLERLLGSLSVARIPPDTNLVFSLEYNAHAEVIAKCKSFEWHYGSKEIIQHDQKLGLVNHYLFCGGLTRKYKAIVYLEDDLYVAPYFYNYAQKLLSTYQDDPGIAGFSLNSLWFNGYLHLPFRPVQDGNSCYFLQVPWYQGQVYTEDQWNEFEKWFINRKPVGDDVMMHDLFRDYKLSDDWFPLKVQYLIETNRFYCFPRVSYCTNFGDLGTHFSQNTLFFQSELTLGPTDSNFWPRDKSIAVYDSHFELVPEVWKQLFSEYGKYDFEPDLNGTKNLKRTRKNYVLTSRPATKSIRSYGLEMHPQELNIIQDVSGSFFHLAEVSKVSAKECPRYLDFWKYHHRSKLSLWKKLKLLIAKRSTIW
ncbi:hypothetical protein [Marinoscillum sp. MHG1-6]|uniref:hypothetical protein n=1 Tax=Marinoscillum sp. MHG1-6 TaxID=2959627 RepID=UPI002157D1B2|nr:hypothetical protein [Marinoscillum sp. MHG1-6]